MARSVYLIGLTGNIATGKSTVSGMLRDLGAHVIDADRVAHEVMEHGSAVWEAIVERFGTDVVGADGEIDRRALGRIVFADPTELAALERIVHPAVIDEIEHRIERIGAADPRAVIVVEAIKLIESGMYRRYDALWVVTCSKSAQLARLMARNGLNEREARLRMEAQSPAEQKVALADVVIDNSGTLAATAAQVRAAWRAVGVGLDKTA